MVNDQSQGFHSDVQLVKTRLAIFAYVIIIIYYLFQFQFMTKEIVKEKVITINYSAIKFSCGFSRLNYSIKLQILIM